MNRMVWTGGSVLAGVFLFVNISFLSAIGAPVGIARNHGLVSFLDQGFDEKFRIENRTIKCTQAPRKSYYPSPMYTCQDIRVDGFLLYHGYAQDSKRRDVCTKECPCGPSTGEPNDVHALCKAMLKAHQVSEPLIAAYVVQPSCTIAEQPEERIKYFYDANNTASWKVVNTTNGFINVLQCLTEKPPAYL